MDRVLVTLRLEQEGNTLIDCFCAGKLCLFCDALSLAGDAVECSTAVFIGQQSVADKLPCNGNPALRKIQPVGVWIAGKIINGLVERACCSRNAAQQLGSRQAKAVCVGLARSVYLFGHSDGVRIRRRKGMRGDDDGERGKRACLGVAGKQPNARMLFDRVDQQLARCVSDRLEQNEPPARSGAVHRRLTVFEAQRK